MISSFFIGLIALLVTTVTIIFLVAAVCVATGFTIGLYEAEKLKVRCSIPRKDEDDV